jgi:hypothetical protein
MKHRIKHDRAIVECRKLASRARNYFRSDPVIVCYLDLISLDLRIENGLINRRVSCHGGLCAG